MSSLPTNKRKLQKDMKDMKEEEKSRKRQQLEEARQEAECRRKQKELEDKKTIEDVPENIRNPKGQNRNKKKPLKFIVWSSDGYDNDGWHSYNEPPRKVFDSTFSSKNDANARARYLFFVENSWGLGVDEMLGLDYDETHQENDLLMFEVCPPDSTRWTVAVVPKEAFPYMQKQH